jgi:hypothetical protein
MEAFWVYPWFIWAGTWPVLDWKRPLLSLISVILLIGVSFIVTRFFLSRSWRLRWVQLAIVACGLVAIFVAVWVEYGAGFGPLSGQWFARIGQSLMDSFSHPQPLAMALVAGVYLWWRGIRWGRSPFRLGDIYRSFIIGLTALVLLVLVWGVSLEEGASETLLANTGIYIAGFFFFGLLALALGNLQAIHQKMLGEGEKAPLFSRRWLSILLGMVGGIVIVGMALASIFSFDLIGLLAQGLDQAADWLFTILRYIVVGLGFVGGALGVVLSYAIKFIVNLFGGGEPPEPLESSDFPGTTELQEGGLNQLPPEAILAIKWGFFAVIAAVVVFLLVKAVSRYWTARTKGEVEEVHESLLSWDVFKADLRLFFSMVWQRIRMVWHKFRPRQKPSATEPIPVSYADAVASGRLNIREIYRYLLWEASCSGVARGSHETVYEYAERLGQAVPECSEQLAELTGLYIDVRYGDFKAPRGKVNRANNLWKTLRELLQRLRRV